MPEWQHVRDQMLCIVEDLKEHLVTKPMNGLEDVAYIRGRIFSFRQVLDLVEQLDKEPQSV